MINEATINETTTNKITINQITVNEAMIDEAMIKKINIDGIIVSEATIINKSSINEAITTNKAKNNANICDEHMNGNMQHKYTKKEENIFIQKVNPLDTLNLILKLDYH